MSQPVGAQQFGCTLVRTALPQTCATDVCSRKGRWEVWGDTERLEQGQGNLTNTKAMQGSAVGSGQPICS